VAGHSSRVEQVEDRNSELKDKIKIEGKIKEVLVKQLKSCERNMQELTDFIKRPNLKIMGIEGEEVQAKRIHTVFKKVVTEKSSNLKKVLPIQVQEASRMLNRLLAYHH
jgi:hypothetical protein